jgi:hypothetical protein
VSSDIYNIVLVQPKGYEHTPVFVEVARLLSASLTDLGHPCNVSVNTLYPNAINILLGYQMAEEIKRIQGYPFIIYQLEQLLPGDARFRQTWLDLLPRARAVWDYSTLNIEFLRAHGFDGAKYLPLGYHPSMATIPHAEQDIDVLFYGSAYDRRVRILEQINQRCVFAQGFRLYGPQRDAAIARAKIILNVHMADDSRFEQTRVSYLLNNERFILSEPAADNPYGDMVPTAPYEQIVEACMMYLADDEKRRQVAHEGAEKFKGMPMVELLRDVL